MPLSQLGSELDELFARVAEEALAVKGLAVVVGEEVDGVQERADDGG